LRWCHQHARRADRPRHYPADQSFQNGPTSGKDVFIPMDTIIGGKDRVGQGWRMLMDCLAAGRAISLPALGTGAAMFCAGLPAPMPACAAIRHGYWPLRRR